MNMLRKFMFSFLVCSIFIVSYKNTTIAYAESNKYINTNKNGHMGNVDASGHMRLDNGSNSAKYLNRKVPNYKTKNHNITNNNSIFKYNTLSKNLTKANKIFDRRKFPQYDFVWKLKKGLYCAYIKKSSNYHILDQNGKIIMKLNKQ